MYQLKRNYQQKKLVLLVDDERVNQVAAASILKKLQFEVHIAANGWQALERVYKNDYALILMDCHMPVMDGLSASRAIRTREERSGDHVPIIAFTAGGSKTDCLEAGMDHYLTKPLRVDALREAIEAVGLNECADMDTIDLCQVACAV